MSILMTGGAGFIGSHTCLELLEEEYDIVVIDNLVNSSKKSLDRVEILTGKEIKFYQGDVSNVEILNKIFYENKITACIHFAGLKSVFESVEKPLEYYRNNLISTINLLEIMKKNDVKNIIFSSSATVYGQAKEMPITEETPKLPCTNPYGWTKSMIEQILVDLYTSDKEWNIILLRYFNPLGAHPSGLLGEDPNGIPNNLMPYIAKVAFGQLNELGVFGDDYDTPDGTGVRDYIHVVDLARGHVKALNHLKDKCGLKVYNLGTGKGYSVLEVINSFERVNSIKIPYSIKPRRKGDIGVCYCSPKKAEKELGWTAEYNIDDMCRDAWKWQRKNPNGYR